jgi:hypothetical protein
VTPPSGTPVLAPAPGHAPGTGANAGRLYDASHARRLDAAASAFDRAVDGWTMHRLTVIRPATATDPGEYKAEIFPASAVRPNAYGEWLDHVWPATACTHPIRLHGSLGRIDAATGEVLSSVSTDDLPDSAIYKPCGNRRSTVCPGCAETYRRDAFQLIRAGLAGGKGVSASVAAHPAVFATFTAPSFGPVHARPVHRHTCRDRSACRCKAEPCHARRDASACPHGVRMACYRRHRPGDSTLGQPICPDCYDYDAHAVWNHAAGELWRRTKQDIERRLNQLAARRGIRPHPDGTPALRVSHGKVAEYQARGAVHFHVVLRLDGTDPGDPDRLVPPPPGITAADLEDAIRHAAGHIAWRTPPHPGSPDGFGWRIAWGAQTDVRVIAAHGDVSDLAVAGYLAKYSTKGTETSGHASARLTPATVSMYPNRDGTHPERLIHACWAIGTAKDYRGLRRWAHMLGFGGHFLTKARRYSVTFAALRQARITYRRTQDPGPEHGPIDGQDDIDTQTTITITSLSYAGIGWHTSGDALLASTAADMARRRRQAGREEIAGEYASTSGSRTAA